MTDSGTAAAIDIGTNAVRLLIGSLDSSGKIAKHLFTRVPLGLGRASYGSERIIGGEDLRRLCDALDGLKKIAHAMDVKNIRAVATAAVRESRNLDEVLIRVEERAGVKMEILSGRDEAVLVGEFVAAQFRNVRSVLNADTGGGSTDFALAEDGKIADQDFATFKIGTAREGGGNDQEKEKMRNWLIERRARIGITAASGGGMRKIAKACDNAVTPDSISDFINRAEPMSDEERATAYGLPPDRARNIIPAARICRMIMDAAGAEKLNTVQGGLGEAVLSKMLPSAGEATSIA